MAKIFYNESELVFVEKLKRWSFQDLTGQKFSRLTVLGFAGENPSGNSLWFCKCDCGNITKVIGSGLKNGSTSSCGCFKKEQLTKHGHSIKGKQSRTYVTWESMIAAAKIPKGLDLMVTAVGASKFVTAG